MAHIMKKSTLILKRIIADLIDWNLIFLLGGACFFGGPNFDPIYLLYPSIKMLSAPWVLLGVTIMLLLPFLKDCIFCGASLGKLLMGLRVVNAETGRRASFGSMILRNVTFYIIEVDWILLFVTGRSLSDRLTKTIVCSYKFVIKSHGKSDRT